MNSGKRPWIGGAIAFGEYRIRSYRSDHGKHMYPCRESGRRLQSAGALHANSCKARLDLER